MLLHIISVSFISLFSQAADLTTTPLPLMKQKTKTLASLGAKANLVVNIATRCGYTPQLKGLESLYSEYKSKGLVVIGIPSNDFGSQTPEKNDKVKDFCKLKYGVSFPLTRKIKVTGKNKHPWIKTLLEKSKDSTEISWNFEKFLIDRQGTVVARFTSNDKPRSKKIINELENLLK